MVSVSVRYLFYKPVDEKIKTWTFRFPAKENPYMVKALFDRPIVWQYDVKEKYRLISRNFSRMKFFQPSVRLRWLNTVVAVSEYNLCHLPNYGKRRVAAHKLKLALDFPIKLHTAYYN